MGAIKKIYRFFRSRAESAMMILFAPYYFFLTRETIWRWKHKKEIKRYEKDRPRFLSFVSELAKDMKKNGIAVAHISSLIDGGERLLFEMQNALTMCQLKRDRRSLFLKHFFEEKDLQDLSNPFLRFALDENVLATVSAYFGSAANLRHLGANMTLPEANSGDAQGSQRWHRDPGLFKLCKVFLYFNDILELSSGPFIYVKKSQPGGKYGHVYKQGLFGKMGIYPPEGAVEKDIPQVEIFPCLGKAGTVVFCNTTGLHKGGYSTLGERKMLTAVYTYYFDNTPPSRKYPINFENNFAKLGKLGQLAISSKTQL